MCVTHVMQADSSLYLNKVSQHVSKLGCRFVFARDFSYALSDSRSHLLRRYMPRHAGPSPVRRDADPVHGLGRRGKIIGGIDLAIEGT